MQREEEIDDSPRSPSPVPRRARLLGDGDIAAILTALKSDQPSTSAVVPAPPMPTFLRKGFATQFQFNESLLKRLATIKQEGLRGEDGEQVQKVMDALKTRNETLKIADKHPEVFTFLEAKKQSEAVKSSDPHLSEFLEQLQKEEKRSSRKRQASPSFARRPFRGGSRDGDPAPEQAATRRNIGSSDLWTGRNTETTTRLAQLTKTTAPTKQTDRKAFASYVATRDIGVMNVQGENSEFVAGAIHEHISMWSALEPNALVLDTIVNGYTIPFHVTPESIQRASNRKSTARYQEFVNSTIAELKSSGAIREASQNERKNLFINPLSVAEGKKPRQVLDLSQLNKFVYKEYVKYDDLSRIMHSLPYNGFMTTFDLKNGYHHVRIAEERQRFLGFEWASRVYQFTVLPFGLSSAPHILTKLLRTSYYI